MSYPERFPVGDRLPLSIDDLVRAYVLLGQSEARARELWTHLIASDATRREANQADGITLSRETLMLLSLLSPELSEKVDRLREHGLAHSLRHLRESFSEEEFQRRAKALAAAEHEWEEQRARLRRALADSAPPG